MPKQHENDPAMNPSVIQNQIMTLTRTVGGLTQAVETLTSNWIRQDESANNGRAKLHEKIDAVRSDVATLTNRVDNLDKAITLIQPSITVFTEQRLRDEGARLLGKKQWAFLLTAAGLTGWALHEFFSYLFHH